MIKSCLTTVYVCSAFIVLFVDFSSVSCQHHIYYYKFVFYDRIDDAEGINSHPYPSATTRHFLYVNTFGFSFKIVFFDIILEYISDISMSVKKRFGLARIIELK